MRKGRDGGEKKSGEVKKKIKTFLVATNVVASRPPERRPTATPTARANSFFSSEISTGILKNDFSRMDSQLGKLFCEFHRFPPYRKSFFSLPLILSNLI